MRWQGDMAYIRDRRRRTKKAGGSNISRTAEEVCAVVPFSFLTALRSENDLDDACAVLVAVGLLDHCAGLAEEGGAAGGGGDGGEVDGKRGPRNAVFEGKMGIAPCADDMAADGMGEVSDEGGADIQAGSGPRADHAALNGME